MAALRASQRVPGRAMLAALPVTLVAFAGSAASARTCIPTPAGFAPPVVAAYAIAPHPKFDRVVFTFRGGLPRWRTSYGRGVFADGSGAPVPFEGNVFLTVVFQAAVIAWNVCHPNLAVERTATPRLRELRQMKVAGDFEGYVTYGFGLSRRTSVHVFTLRHPDRLVLDFAH